MFNPPPIKSPLALILADDVMWDEIEASPVTLNLDDAAPGVFPIPTLSTSPSVTNKVVSLSPLTLKLKFSPCSFKITVLVGLASVIVINSLFPTTNSIKSFFNFINVSLGLVESPNDSI